MPFTDRVADKPVPHDWDAIHLENEFIAVLILPEIGGRIHRMLDKTNGYDVIYYQPVIYARELEKQPATIDYFATSLPAMLLFDEDLQACQTTIARFLQAQALLGLGQKKRARALLEDVLRRDPTHALAADLLAES